MTRRWRRELSLALLVGALTGLLFAGVAVVRGGDETRLGSLAGPAAAGLAFGFAVALLGRLVGARTGRRTATGQPGGDRVKLILAALVVVAILFAAMYLLAPALAGETGTALGYADPFRNAVTTGG